MLSVQLENEAIVQNTLSFICLDVFNNSVIGINTDGICVIEGYADGTNAIPSEISYPVLNLGSANSKEARYMYIRLLSLGPMTLQVAVDESSGLGTGKPENKAYNYVIPSTKGLVKQVRVTLGRGLKGTHYRFKILNPSGYYFTLYEMQFLYDEYGQFDVNLDLGE